MATRYENSRLLIKNLPITLDVKRAEQLIQKKCKDIGLVYCDCKLLTKKKRENNEVKEVFRGLCFLGFLTEKDATKFLEYYNGTYFRACKVSIEYSSHPPRGAEQESSRKEDIVVSTIKEKHATIITKTNNRITKAGVANKKRHILYQDDDPQSPLAEGSPLASPKFPEETDNPRFSEGDGEKGKLSAGQRDVLPGGEIQRPLVSSDISEIGRVVVFNLPYSITEGIIRDLCKPYGPVVEIHIPMNKFADIEDDKLTRGYCYITWVFPSDAIRFRDEKNRTIFCGRIIHIEIAAPKSTDKHQLTYDEIGHKILNKRRNTSSYKTQLEKKRKEQASDPSIWNTLHIDINAVIHNVSQRLKINKDDILNETNAAINATLSETFVINQLTSWLKTQGINYDQYEIVRDGEDAKEVMTKRSDDTIVVKNLSSESSELELLEMFRGYGELLRFSLSPFMVIGIVQYFNSKDAKNAFNSLSYKPYCSLPLYLEWAPINLFYEDSIPMIDVREQVAEANEEDIVDTVVEEDIPEECVSVSIYIKNLDFKTRDADLEKHFAQTSGYRSCKVVMKDKLSMGFGFVEFDSLENAKRAIVKNTGVTVNGRLLDMSISKQKKEIEKISKSKLAKATNKLIVKNLAFQATKPELYKLFSFYGNVKSIRIPKSLKNHRGFAFVEYMTKQEAIHAMESLQHSHLYGRHIILEFTEDSSKLDTEGTM